jgi:hypothetical protein
MNEKEIKLKNKLERDVEDLRHENRCVEIEMEKKAKLLVENIKFDHQCQIQRIRSAEIKRNIKAKKDYGY